MVRHRDAQYYFVYRLSLHYNTTAQQRPVTTFFVYNIFSFSSAFNLRHHRRRPSRPNPE